MGDGAMSNHGRLRELAARLVAEGPKASAVSASECHEISNGLVDLIDEVERLRPAWLIGSFGSPHFEERQLPRDTRQAMIASWAAMAFGRDEATGIPQRGLRLLEEAIEAYQACGCDEAMAHKLVTFVFEREPGQVGQELGGVAVTTLLLAAAAGVSADDEEAREIHRVLSKPIKEFTARNANKNAAGFKIP